MLDDPRISRAHARIELGPAGWVLVDLGSRNGGFVDGSPIDPNSRTSLMDGAIIRLGNTLLLFRASPAMALDTADHAAFPGRSPAAALIRRRLDILAKRGGHVLVLGETGTGKERVARALAPTQPGAPFVVQNCAELTRELARAELCGHLRGAFTGAQSNRVGLIEAADGGVLFLDELGELSLDVQGELLRFLEDGSYRPLGSLELRHSRARVVAATNVDLESAVRTGKFRRDLRARLMTSNAPLLLPPLRDRREDLPGWTHMFAAEAGAPVTGEGAAAMWTAGALECLLLHPWPENLRELRGLVRSLIDERVAWPIPPEALPAPLRTRRSTLRRRDDDALLPRLAPSCSLPGQRFAPEPSRENIEHALRSAQGNMKVAAEMLCLERRKLYRLCERFGISFEIYRPTP